MFEYVLGLLVILYGIYWWLTKNHDHWKKRGVPFVPPHILVGNMGEMVTMKKSQGQIVDKLYNTYKKEPFIGIFNMTKPGLLLNDLDIVRTVLVKDFGKFHNNTFNINEEVDPIIAKNPFFLKGDRWKLIRGQLTPLLTTGKVKVMFPLVEQVCKNMVKYIEKIKQEDGIEAKDLALKFTTDNVASCAFGLEGHSFDNPEAEFRKLVDNFLKLNFWANIKFIIITIFPDLAKILKVSIGQTDISDQFKIILKEAVKYRKEQNVVRNDFLDSIIELKSKPMSFEFTDDYMLAHALTFFLDGSETSALSLSFALYEIAANHDIQNKLVTEIKKISDKYGGNITFDAIQEMRYLDAIFLETLRKYPPQMVMSRECTEETKLPRTSGDDLKIEKGSHVFVPVFALHRDAEYYPDPDNFDPDRFTSDAKYPLPKNCYFGFGDGPRICIGQKFANMQVKAGLIAAVSNFEVRVNKRTIIPFEFNPQTFLVNVKGGIWLNFSKRNK